MESYNIQVKKFKRDEGGFGSLGLKYKLVSGKTIEILVSTVTLKISIFQH